MTFSWSLRRIVGFSHGWARARAGHQVVRSKERGNHPWIVDIPHALLRLAMNLILLVKRRRVGGGQNNNGANNEYAICPLVSSRFHSILHSIKVHTPPHHGRQHIFPTHHIRHISYFFHQNILIHSNSLYSNGWWVIWYMYEKQGSKMGKMKRVKGTHFI